MIICKNNNALFIGNVLGITIIILLMTTFVSDAAINPEWKIETLESAGSRIISPSIAIDTFGRPHISYHENIYPYSIKYAKWTGSNWTIQTVDSGGFYSSIALDSSGFPDICYLSNGNLKYARWTGNSWLINTVDFGVGDYNSLALDSNDKPRISYYNVSNGDLKYALLLDSGSWNIGNVDTDGDVGQYSSIGLDKANNPHISYYNVTGGDLKYARLTTRGMFQVWIIETLDSAGNVGLYTSMALDSSDIPHITYYFPDGGLSRYARKNGSSWEIQNLNYASLMNGNNLALDSNGNPHIVYYDMTNYDLVYGRWTGKKWNIRTVDSAGVVGYYIR